MESESRFIAEPKDTSRRRRGRVLFLSTDMGMGGGAEEQVIQLAVALAARDWSTMIVSMLPPSPMPPEFHESGVPLTHLGMRRGIPNPFAMRRLARIIREFQPQIVHSHLTHASLLARVVRVIQPYPVGIGTMHSLTMTGVDHDRTAIYETAHRLTDRLSDCTTAICQAAADYYIRRKAVPAAKMKVVYNGVDTVRFRPNPQVRDYLRRDLGIDSTFVWLAVGRLESVKAYPTLLNAFAQINDQSATLLICGKGSLESSLMALATKLGISQRVRFLGLRTDIPDIMNAADAFALSSDLEGLPLVLLQASAVGLPIVATDVGGNKEVVREQVNGYIVPPGDPAAFAQAMNRVASLSPSAAAELARAGRASMCRCFENQRIIDQWEQLYGSLIAGNRLHTEAAAADDSRAEELVGADSI